MATKTNNKPARGSKTKAIAEAMAAGIDKPKAIAEFVKEKHGLEISVAYISSQKSAIKKKSPGKKIGRPKGSRSKPAMPVAAATNGEARKAIQAVKEAAMKVGGLKQLKGLVDDLISIA